ncbi:hypothetical protein CK203_034290 [Vitis vinifera]|uniref:Uncharacterized protein n=1 Tax=Vitis vinifera TaxID=29760 RepID=A0A438BWE2_VITVI|nr:hypothetical protein CK203_085597 [Vitis vinifera]RVW98317.1 hypothetical protein CK203_034290 [Vitis vinifera]
MVEQLVCSTIPQLKIHTNDEDEMDDNLQHGGVHVDVDCESPNDPLRLVIEGDVTTCSRKCTSEYCGDGKGKKESRLGQMGDALKSWAETFKHIIDDENKSSGSLYKPTSSSEDDDDLDEIFIA